LCVLWLLMLMLRLGPPLSWRSGVRAVKASIDVSLGLLAGGHRGLICCYPTALPPTRLSDYQVEPNARYPSYYHHRVLCITNVKYHW
jgi:hypothetical protein